MTDTPFIALKDLYTRMDHVWGQVAEAYEFICNGCTDNCCYSLFFHHTYIEKAYLIHGFNRLDQNLQKTIQGRADRYIQQMVPDRLTTNSARLICPLNTDGQCILYDFRPMICRLHGLPHELCRPGGVNIKSPGCNAGSFDDKPYIPFDRTLFYQQMAQVEMNFRQDRNKSGKIKETIAQMLISP